MWTFHNVHFRISRDIMATLVAYSDSGESESDEDGAVHTKKRQRVEQTADEVRWIRSFPHVDGNWPSYISFQVHPSKLMREMADYAMQLAQTRAAPMDLRLVPIESPYSEPSKESDVDSTGGVFHLSLSRTFVLKRAEIDPFIRALRLALRYRKRLRVGVQGLRVLVNDERTRLFVTVPVVAGAADVCHVIRCVDKCMQQFDLAVYYAVRRPHR
ncbi:hypothetical protein H310_01824 [Aphanomyces invadans]|uniref:U6 snRNA phosphodiesterase 1 n=1 Tax=Aphanomyces invadans TaxID=157072 RepID=A0A024UM44_9STRA|nr:hypothetical protein H310_01824 [Aphanomyces invadans]ETW07260.1 hypothetical protein H310_01824 [Aphanomyces invadans]|eukprot:XP_008863353.1 hypothetical protein H310_01824 [Aphanomyces invadans]